MSVQVQKQKAVTNPLNSGSPLVEQKPLPEKIAIEVSYGANKAQFSVRGEQTMGEVLSIGDIAAEIGYGDLSGSNVVLIAGGQIVDKSYMVMQGDVLEIIKKAGEKA